MTIRDQWVKPTNQMYTTPTTPTYIENYWEDEAGLIDGLSSGQMKYLLTNNAATIRTIFLKAFDDVEVLSTIKKHTPPFWANDYRSNKRKKK